MNMPNPAINKYRRSIKRPISGQRGFTLTELMFVVFIIAVIAAIAIPMYYRFIQRARETAVITYLDKVRKAEDIHLLQNSSNLYSGNFEDLEATGAVPPGTGDASRVQDDYRFDLTAGVSPSNEPIYSVNANPVNGSTAVKWFYIDQTGIIRFNMGAAADSSSQPVNP